MSGFVGILSLDGAPVDRALLERMTRYLSFRGPDAQEIWCEGPVGLGHALLQVTNGSVPEKQPAQLDGRLWIAADARIDARAELISKLKAKRQTANALSLLSPDAELILHAYNVWGQDCVEHLMGDFSFAIWDGLERRLFCGRDHFGIKPFYFAHVGSGLIFSNTLNCIRIHPSVSSRLNDLAIADFLLFDTNRDPSTTTFADIRRLPPGHTLICEPGAVSVRRYWELMVTAPVHYLQDSEYVENFRELLDRAVADRLRTAAAGVLMSGGLDSTTVAASAVRVIQRHGQCEERTNLSAYTEVIETLIPHEERRYAMLAGAALHIPITFSSGDRRGLFETSVRPERCSPEPVHSAVADTTLEQLRQLSVGGHVALTGYGADPALCGRISVHFNELLTAGRFVRAASDAFRYLASEKRLSRLYLRTRLGILFNSRRMRPSYPDWLNEDFERRMALRERWDSLNEPELPRGALRPEAQLNLMDSMWPQLFEAYDPGVTRIPVEVRHPFFDLRLLNFLLGLARLPWCCDKELLREAGRHVLPDEVRLRRKSPLLADPLVALLRRPESEWVDRFEGVQELEGYVIRGRIPKVFNEKDPWTCWINLRPLSLNLWLSGRDSKNNAPKPGLPDLSESFREPCTGGSLRTASVPWSF